MNYNFFNILIFSGVIYGFIFSVDLGISKKHKSPSIPFLILSILSLCFSNLQYWIIDTGNFLIPDIYRLKFEVLMVPFFYFFLKKYLQIDTNKTDKLLFVPFFLGIIYKGIIYSSSLSKNSIDSFNFYIELLVIFFNVFVILLCLSNIKKYEEDTKNTEIKPGTNWIVHSLYGGFLLIPLWIYITIYHQNIWPYYYPLWIGISILVFFIGNRAISELDVVSERKHIRASKKMSSENSSDFKQQKGSQSTYQDIINEISRSKLYLNPTISLSAVAKEFDMSSNYISQLFGKHSNIGFNEYINRLRVEEAKKMLRDKDFDHYTAVAIGLESGFNSKSTFFSVFKKHTGFTPAEFKNSPRI